MRIKPGFLLKKIAGAYTAIPVGENYNTVGALISLNDSGAFLWQYLCEDCSPAELKEALAEEYRISPELAEEATAGFLALLREHGLLEEEPCTDNNFAK